VRQSGTKRTTKENMSFRKISDFTECDPICNHPEHNPPNQIVLSPGTYEHQCPGCDKKIRFIVRPTCHTVESKRETCGRF
jgi:hypothetical protein